MVTVVETQREENFTHDVPTNPASNLQPFGLMFRNKGITVHGACMIMIYIMSLPTAHSVLILHELERLNLNPFYPS